MAPSLQALVDFLLEEVALCGDQGASPSNILSFIDTFYSKSQQQDASSTISEGSVYPLPSQNVDRKFQERVWSWLTRHPEVSVGKDKEGNHLTLAEVEHPVEVSEADTTMAGTEVTSKTPSVDIDKKNKPASGSPYPIRVFVSKNRNWLAVAGHEPDETKVFPTEFALLSIIASCKARGITQIELVKISGQDKRSVPKRTDMLQRKGYIEKRVIRIRSAWTSLCTLKKFVPEKSLYRTTETPTDNQTALNYGDGNVIDVQVYVDKFFKILREHKIIAIDDLGRLFGFADKWHRKMQYRSIRKFERLGVVKRVKAKSQYSVSSKQLHPCVMLAREPTEKDLEHFLDFGINFLSDLVQETDNANEEQDEDLEPDNATKHAQSAGLEEAVGAIKSEGVEESGRTLPIWTPDRTMPNLLFDVIDSTGTSGKTISELLCSCFGGFFRRPLENALTKLVECWQLSQPPHLRHLAIVRDVAVRRTNTYYVHYSARNFARLVSKGLTLWEAVEFVPKDSKAANMPIPPVDVVPQLDEYGLPLRTPASSLLKGGEASLLQCMLVAKPSDYVISSADPLAVRLDDGSYSLRFWRQMSPNKRARPLDEPPKSGRPKGIPKKSTQRNVVEDISDVKADNIVDKTDAATKRPRKYQTEDESFQGMPEKEKLEAIGLDETWTEYSVFLVERPNPGVYLTPRGRRRPDGKSRGRPRISRLAVFKSPKLISFPWFVKEEPDVISRAHDVKDSVGSPMPDAGRTSSQKQLGDESPEVPVTPSRGGEKRSHPEDEFGDAEPVSKIARGPNRTGLSLPTESRMDRAGTPDEDIVIPASKIAESRTAEQTSEPISASPAADDIPETNPTSTLKRKRPTRRNPKRSVAVRSKKIAQQHISAQTKSPHQGDNGAGYVSSSDETQEILSERRFRKASRTPDRARVPVAPAAPPVVDPESRESFPTETGSVDPVTQTEKNEHDERSEKDNTVVPVARDESYISTAPSESTLATDKTSGPMLIKDTAAATAKTTEKPSEKTNNIRSNHGFSEIREAQKPFGKRKVMEKQGSVAVLRRKTIMDIVEKAGGAFPMGTELWYPFTTAWRKLKFQERPDWRTVRAAAKYMIDAGKLRQLTFSGKDSQGVMTTKSIITKSDIRPDDPLVKSMQKGMLADAPRHHFPPNTEIDTSLKNPSKNEKLNLDPKPAASVETGLTVRLQQKPTYAVDREMRDVRAAQINLLRSLERGVDIDDAEEHPPGVRRLMGIRRSKAPSKTPRMQQAPFLNRLTSISRPRQPDEGESFQVPGRPQGRITRMKRSLVPVAAYTMFINPKQTFHASTGTFSTDSGLAALQMPYFTREKGTATAATTSDTTALPGSLDDILAKTRKKQLDFSSKPDPRSSKFFSDSNTILKWELQSEGLLHENNKDLLYINQTVQDSFDAAPIDGNIRFDVDEPGRQLPPPIEPKVTRRATRSVMAQKSPPVPPLSPRRQSTISTYPVLKGHGPTDNAPSQNRRLAKLNESMTALETEKLSAQKLAAKPAARRNRLLHVPDSFVKRIMTAIVVARTLAGGTDGRSVDWGIVAYAFPDDDAGAIHERGKQILSRNRLQIAKMQGDFQEWFIEAYEKDQVPRIDYQDLEHYDWETVVNWANMRLDAPISSAKIPDLPATREQFDSVFELREEPVPTLDEIYQSTQTVTVNRKRALMTSVPFAIPLRDQSSETTATAPRKRNIYLARLEVAKTWVRANITTPEELYNSTEARRVLDRFGEGLVSDAVQSLVTERSITMGNSSRITPGRNYDITDHFLSMLSRRRFIDSTQLRRAAKFKTTILDPALRAASESTAVTTGTYDIQYGSEDGDILALINLAAEGKVILRPRDPPRDKFGLTDGGYLTRNIDKKKLRFNVEVHPVSEKYEFGNPVWEKASQVPPPHPGDNGTLPDAMHIDQPTSSLPPPPHPSSPLEKMIPVWFDIHGNFIKILWELVVASVVGSVAIRPGTSAAGIASLLKPAMGAWEVRLLLEWMRTVGIVDMKKDGDEDGHGSSAEDRSGWVAQEGWWLVLGS